MKRFSVFFLLVLAFGFYACDNSAFDTLPNNPAITLPDTYSPETSDITPLDTPPDTPDIIPQDTPPDTPLPLNLTRCHDCIDNMAKPYTPRHDGKYEEGVFWEVPIKIVGDSIMPIHDGNSNITSNNILVVDSYEQLNSLRVMVGYPNISRPITHNYSPDFFDTSALIFMTVYTSSGGHVPFIYFYALVTDSQHLYPVFGLDLPQGNYGWTADIGQRSFLIEVDRAIVDNYKIGSLGMGKGWDANWNKFDNDINWLCNECEDGWEFTQPSNEWGIGTGEDDSTLVRQDHDFYIIQHHGSYTR